MAGKDPGQGSRSPLPIQLHPHRQRPDPPLAEVQVAEQQPFLDARGQIQQIQDLAHAGASYAQLSHRLTDVYGNVVHDVLA